MGSLKTSGIRIPTLDGKQKITINRGGREDRMGWRRLRRRPGRRRPRGATGKLADPEETGTLPDLEETRLEMAPRVTGILADPEVNRLEVSPGTHGVLADGRERFEETWAKSRSQVRRVGPSRGRPCAP